MSNNITSYYNSKYFIDNPNLGRMISNKESYLLRSITAKRRYFKNVDIKGKTILDFGCGIGQNTANICNIAKVDGYDVSHFAQEWCRKNTKLNVVNKLKDNYYNIILCSHVLEHLTNPYDIVLMLKRKLKSNGVLIIILPQEFNKNVPLEFDSDRHLYTWNFQSINNLLMYCGFEIISNDMFYCYGFTRFIPLSKFGYRFYYTAVSLFGWMRKSGELRIVAKNSRS